MDELLASKGQSVSKLIMLDVPEEELVKRLLERGKKSGRADDMNEGVIRNRLSVYENETTPVFGFYANANKSVKVWGVGALDMIFKRLSLEIDSI